MAELKTAYDFTTKTLDGKAVALDAYRGQVLLIVNTASKCGFTPQYGGLEALWKKYRERNLTVMGFPCNQFGAQEPGDSAAIADFCSLTYDVSFPMMAKVDVNGFQATPLYTWLKTQKKGFLGSGSIKWNFTKFLIDRDGAVIGRFGPTTEPKDLERAIEAAL